MIIPLIGWGLYECYSTTGIFAALAVVAVALWYSGQNRRKIIIGVCVLAMFLGIWFWQVKPVKLTVESPRWTAWKHAAWSLRSETFGRGLGRWEIVFPLLTSGDEHMNRSGHFAQAHNEPIQVTFELGVQTLALIIAFIAVVLMAVYGRTAPLHESMGMIALIISCNGFFPMHVAPTALLGCAWLGLWHRNRQNQGTFERTGVLSSVESCQGGGRRSWAI